MQTPLIRHNRYCRYIAYTRTAANWGALRLPGRQRHLYVYAAGLPGTSRWLEVAPFASAIVLVIIVVSAAAALGLVVAIASAADHQQQ